MVELSVVGCSCRHSQRDVEEAVGLFWIAVRLVEPLCARACASASASVALPTAGLHPRAASPHSAHLLQVAGGTRHPLASLPLVVVALLLVGGRQEQAPDRGAKRRTALVPHACSSPVAPLVSALLVALVASLPLLATRRRRRRRRPALRRRSRRRRAAAAYFLRMTKSYLLGTTRLNGKKYSIASDTKVQMIHFDLWSVESHPQGSII